MELVPWFICVSVSEVGAARALVLHDVLKLAGCDKSKQEQANNEQVSKSVSVYNRLSFPMTRSSKRSCLRK